jgi:hypothetical protein
VIEWRVSEAAVIETRSSVEDMHLLELIQRGDKVGVDVPFGWPDAFVKGVSAHHAGRGWPAKVLRTAAYYRATDLFVIERTKCRPLSVAADRIAVPAIRAARVFARLARRSEPVLRDGKGKIVEVYPAAALRVWGLTWKGYKGAKNRKTLCELSGNLTSQTAKWLRIPAEVQVLFKEADHLFDALVAALVARAAAVGLCEDVPLDQAGRARREGWIAVPKPGSLEMLWRGGESRS